MAEIPNRAVPTLAEKVAAKRRKVLMEHAKTLWDRVNNTFDAWDGVSAVYATEESKKTHENYPYEYIPCMVEVYTEDLEKQLGMDVYDQVIDLFTQTYEHELGNMDWEDDCGALRFFPRV